MTATAPHRTAEQLATAVADQLGGIGRLGVAYSGGVDSATLLAVAVRTLGQANVLAILAVSPSLASDERELARTTAAAVGASLLEVATDEGARPAYVANGPDRCFHCKDELFSVIDDAVRDAHGLDAIAYGENADDVRRLDRPGARAATEHGVLRPLAAAGLTKADVRTLARHLGLAVHDKPAAPCLASRIPHHEPVIPEKLAQIDRAESALRALGLREVRVRHHGEVARVELGPADLERALRMPWRESVEQAVRAAGFASVVIDPDGLQSGAFTMRELGLAVVKQP